MKQEKKCMLLILIFRALSANSNYGENIDMMVFTLESLINSHLGIKYKDTTKVFHKWFSSLLINLSDNEDDIVIKLIESFSSGGWHRVYT